MIQQSGHFEYDKNLDAFYDYERYGTERMNAEDGMFTDQGYIAYKGYTSMEEVMNGSQSSRMEMGGMMSVSYTHLDVYKRQGVLCGAV